MRKPTKFTVSVLVLLVLMAAIGVWLFQHAGSSARDTCNVLLISIDTCRADYLGCYGYSRKITPNIDALAEESILFENTYSPVPITLPAHSSMLTGTIPPYHGVHDNSDYRLGESNETLAEILHKNRFTTGAVISAFVLHSKFGLSQGFDYYNDGIEKRGNADGFDERKGEDSNRFAFEWLDKHKSERFFLFLHYFDPHQPYTPPEPFASEFQDNLYAGEIAYTDSCIGRIIKKLKELGLYESTLIIITADHGEMLGEHQELTHSYFIYQSAIKVPLIFKLPGRSKAEKIDDPVGLIDIVPTVCGTLSIAMPAHVQGEDLSGYFSGKQRSSSDRHLYCESLSPTRYNANSLLGLVTDQWKFIQTTRPELYDLAKDPSETTNLIDQQPHRARVLQDRLRQILEKSRRGGDFSGKAEMDEQDKNRLESLGYIARSSVREDFKFDQTKDDPKDLIGFVNWDLGALANIREKEYTAAKTMCEKMLLERPQYLGTYILLAKIARGQGDLDEAVSSLTRAVRLETGAAEELHVKPNFVDIHNDLGNVLAAQGKIREAITHYSEALRIDPNDVKAHNNLGLTLAGQGRINDAMTHYSEALRIDPDYPEVHYNLGAVLIRLQRFNEAIYHFRQALRIRPDFPEARSALKIATESRGEKTN
jgi:arylsulfatase A-like enzyme/Tfp pilus assembly protein PilF